MRILGAPLATLVKVLVFVLVSAVFTFLLAIRIGNLDLFSSTKRMEAAFSDANGVFEGDAVKVAGVDVGRVVGTRIEDGKAIITFDVDREVAVTTASTVAIRWRNILGLRFLYLHPGAGGTPLEEGDRIPDDRTDEAGDLTAFLNRLGPILKAIDAEKANAFLDSMNTALAGNEAVVRALLTSGATVADELGSMDAEIKSLIGSSDTVLKGYAKQKDAIGSIVEDLDAIGGELSANTASINSFIVNLAEVQRQTERLLRENRDDIDADIAHLANVAELLAANRGRLDRTLCSLPTGVAPYQDTTAWGQWFNVRIVQFLFKDNEGNIIASQKEVDGSRPPGPVKAVECPDGTPLRRAFKFGGSAPGAGSSQVAATQTVPAPSDHSLAARPERPGGLGDWIDSLVGGS